MTDADSRRARRCEVGQAHADGGLVALAGTAAPKDHRLAHGDVQRVFLLRDREKGEAREFHLGPAADDGSFSVELSLDSPDCLPPREAVWDAYVVFESAGERDQRRVASSLSAAPSPVDLADGRRTYQVAAYVTAKGNLSFRVTLVPGPRIFAAQRRWLRREVGRPLGRMGVRLALRLLRVSDRRRARRLPATRSTHAVHLLLMHAYGMGGTIRTVHNLAGHLAHDHEVTLYSVIRTREEPFFPFPEDITVTPLDDRTEAGRPRGPVGLVHGILSRMPSTIVHVDDGAYKTSSMWTDVQLLRTIRSLRSGVLITTRPALNLIASVLAPPGVITIGQEHMNLGVHKPGLRKAIKRNYRRLDALAVLTDGDRDSYEPLLGSAPTRLMRIPNAVPRLGGGMAQYDSKVVVAAGRLTNQKGFDLLIRAWAQVKPVHPDWTLRIYGSGPWQEKLQRMIAEHGLADNVFLMGRASNMGEEFAKGSIYALSSRFEGFAMVVIEAMSKGLPMVAFDCPTGPADVVVPGENGALIKPGDIEGFAAALIELMGDEDERRRRGGNARETARTYDLDVVGAQWHELFTDLASSPPSVRLKSVR